MPVQIQLTAKDYRRAYRAHVGWVYFFFPAMGSLLILGGICHSWIEMSAVNGIGLIALGVFAISLLPLVLYQQFKSNKKLTIPFNITPSLEGIEMTADYGNSLTRWKAYVQFVENKELFLLYPQPALFLVYPKRFFSPEQLEEFGRLVRTNVLPKKRSLNTIRTLVIWIVIIISIWVLYQVLQSQGR